MTKKGTPKAAKVRPKLRPHYVVDDRWVAQAPNGYHFVNVVLERDAVMFNLEAGE